MTKVLFRARSGTVEKDDFWDMPETRPLDVVFILFVVKAVSQPDSPDDVEVCPDAGHDVPIQ